jgi:hypothetical protein
MKVLRLHAAGDLREWAAWSEKSLFPILDSISEADGAMLEPLGVAICAIVFSLGALLEKHLTPRLLFAKMLSITGTITREQCIKKLRVQQSRKLHP